MDFNEYQVMEDKVCDIERQIKNLIGYYSQFKGVMATQQEIEVLNKIEQLEGQLKEVIICLNSYEIF
ncbi:hypothetical protein OXPF_32990 [Oxobacter pfennigii]|uniref:Uncharacterized protein n=1 Tax=Oxobacter pfennigii TaxID=36849 RepID=A0A0P8WXI6_9CLOT|nr:hypothetical protein [Oxobacter pfennigii]KPU43049.1 hypothetical protein OXPF_32990 [Oxobacter pfennigii]